MWSNRAVAAFVATIITLGALGCYKGGAPGPSQPNTFINIFTVQDTSSVTGIPGTSSPMPGIGVYGSAVNPPFSSLGTVGFFDEYTNDDGVYNVNNAIVPANWEFQVSLPTWCSTIAVPPAFYNGINGPATWNRLELADSSALSAGDRLKSRCLRQVMVLRSR